MRKIKQFSKRVITALVIAWFTGIVLGAAVVAVQLIRTPDMVSLDALLTYIGAPMTGGIVGYLAKSAFENVGKIKKNYQPDYDLYMFGGAESAGGIENDGMGKDEAEAVQPETVGGDCGNCSGSGGGI